jgi:hypothetical protein
MNQLDESVRQIRKIRNIEHLSVDMKDIPTCYIYDLS